MRIKIDWQQPIQLTHHKKLIFDESELLGKLESRPGVYFFSRVYNGSVHPFYIGETKSIKGRFKSHIRSKAIAFVLQSLGDTPNEVKAGSRYFHFGYLAKNAAEPKRYLSIVQSYLIREAVAQNYVLLNKNLTKKSVHTLEFAGFSEGRAIYPKTASVEI